MPRNAKLFVAVTIASGSMILITSLWWDHYFESGTLFLYCLVLALLASTFKIKLPGMPSTIGASFVLFLIALTELPLEETLMIAALSTLVQCLWRPKSRPAVERVAFSIASTVISIAAAFAATAELKTQALAAALVVASIVFFAVNSALVSVVIALVNRQGPMQVWRNCHRWAFPYYVVGAGLAIAITAYGRSHSWALSFTMLPLLYMTYTCYEQWLKPQRAGAVDNT
ncbi:MAG TPA: hypothetical protein VKX49_08460 [Bryobacteraceae bacterium]|nr:hypothetical protein [Bryobacteraceae bacterium]